MAFVAEHHSLAYIHVEVVDDVEDIEHAEEVEGVDQI